MRVGIVGGLDRNANRYEDFASREGHSLECHSGHLDGTGTAALENLVLRAELVVVVTDVNSHAAVWCARRLSRQHGRRFVLVRRMGLSRLRSLLASGPGGACCEVG